MEEHEAELVSKKKGFSPVWAYFGFKPTTDGSKIDETAPVCRLCKANVSAKSGNTSNLLSHLKHKHPQQYADIQSASSSKSGPKLTQPSIQRSFEMGQPYPRNGKKWQQLTDAVTFAIAKDSMPFTTVERPGFKKLLQTFDQRYVPPGRKYFSKTAVPRLYNATREKVETELKSIQFFSSTTDLWSSRTLHPYMSYTIHYIDQEWEMRSYCLQTAFLPSDHTGDNIADALEATMNGWNLKPEHQVCITTDNGSNVVNATTTKLHWQRLPCFGHNLNLAVTKALKDDNRISRALGLARKIVSSFSASWKRRRELMKAQAAKDLPQHSLINVSVLLLAPV